MADLSRRRLIQAAGAAGAVTWATPGLARAATLPARRVHGDIRDVEHIVILMQENRGFDHLLGTLRGVRGYGDPHPAILPTGKPIWHQPNGAGEVLPYRPDVTDPGLQYLAGTPHGWVDSQQAFNHGHLDDWIAAKGQETMYHFNRADVPYHHALADAFTVCDAYHCSFQGNTDPNRYYMWTGWTGNDGSGGGPVMYNDELGYSWTTYPERLEQAGVSWKIYQDEGEGLDGPHYWGWTGNAFIGNYGDNSLLYFKQYQNSQPGDPLYERARRGTTAITGDDYFRILRADVAADALPQVSWVVAPEGFTEHSNWPVNFGAWYVDQVLQALTSNPDVWAKTALLVTYDENDGFFDHVVPPHVPWEGDADDATGVPGISTVSTEHEVFRNEHIPGSDHFWYPDGGYGLGARVPMWVVSPWSVGGWVCSEVFDHTSTIRFIEKRFGVKEPNITPWRRAVCGDLTSAFDFRLTQRPPRMPSTTGYAPPDHDHHPTVTPVPPAAQSVPTQEPGVRPARPLRYGLDTSAEVSDGTLTLELRNRGRLGAGLQVRSIGTGRDVPPRTFTIEPGREVSSAWDFADGYHLQVHGPNGYFRAFAGSTEAAPEVRVVGDGEGRRRTLRLLVSNAGPDTVVSVADAYTGTTRQVRLRARARSVVRIEAYDSQGWYDVTVTSAADPTFSRTLAGHLDNGRPSTSDPQLGG